MFARDRTEQRKKDFKKAIDVESSRRKREEQSKSLRQSQRVESLQKRRNTTLPTDPNARLTSSKIDNLQTLVEHIRSNDPALQFEATVQFRKLLSVERNPPIQEIIDAGLVPVFVALLQNNGYPKLQFEAAWALTNIASGSSEQTAVVVQHGTVPLFVHLASTSPSDEVREQAIWALGNIAGDSTGLRDHVLQTGALTPILHNLTNNSAKVSMLRNATWSLSNLCRGKPAPPFGLVSTALPTLSMLIQHSDNEVLADACWALSYLSDGDNAQIQTVINSGICERVVKLLGNSSVSVQTPALRVVGNIVSGDEDTQTDFIISTGALPMMVPLLSSTKKLLKKECCWAISNVTAGTRRQIQQVLEAGLIPQLVKLLGNSEFEIKKEAAWAVCNALSGGTVEQVRYIVSQGCIRPLCELLSAAEAKVVTVALEGLEAILKAGEKHAAKTGGENPHVLPIEEAEGLDKIELLQNHQSEEVYKKAVALLETYFGATADDENTNMNQPNLHAFGFNAVPTGGFAF